MSCMRWMSISYYAGLSVAVCSLAVSGQADTTHDPPRPAPPTIVIDGRFEDWDGLISSSPNILPTTDDTFVDIGAVWTRADMDWIYFRFELGRVMNLQGMDGTISLRLDLDGNPKTGATLDGINEKLTMGGVDVELLFSPANASGHLMGVASRIYSEDGSASSHMNPYLLDASFAPTYASDGVELRISRRGISTGEGNPIAREIAAGPSGIRGQLFAITQEGVLVDHSDVFVFPNTGNRPVMEANVRADAYPSLSRAPGTRVRCLTWNIHRGELFKNPPVFARILTALDPDVICFQELESNATSEVLRQWLHRYLPDGASWEARVCPTTGTGVASRLSSVAVGPTVMPLVGDTGRSLRATSLLVGVLGSDQSDGRRIVFISVHLKCCGRAGDPSDQKRVAEGNLIHTLLRRIRYDADPSGIVVMGDFNLVGSRDPLDAMMAGEDLDGSDLLDVAPRVLGDQTNTTWRSMSEPFLPGRLDFALVSDSVFRVLNSFVFDTQRAAEVGKLPDGLKYDDTLVASDHLPLVVDLGW